MTLWLLPILPLVGGLALWAGASARPLAVRGLLGGAAVFLLGLLGGLVAWVLLAGRAAERAAISWGGGLSLELALTPEVSLMVALVPAIALPIVVWAAAHEPREGLARLVGLLVAFVGAMELLILAADLVTLMIGWELVGALSWALIGHRWRSGGATRSAAYAFNATRAGGLGLLLAAGAAVATTGSFSFDALEATARSSRGGLLAAGLLIAAAAKSAQLPFSPWLFRAMEGPTSVSALLHASTMVAAGAWILLRLEPALSQVPWFGPATLGLGLSTAWVAGWVACLQPHAKRLLAASTSAHYGFMLVAVGAGSAGAALVHLVAHAAFKALLFLVAGTAMGAAGTALLGEMRLGRRLPWTAAFSAVGALALAGVPPLGAAWTKERIVAAAGHTAPVLAVLVVGAAALSAWYAARFQLLAFGRSDPSPGTGKPAGWTVRVALGALALASVLLGLLWLHPISDAVKGLLGLSWPKGTTWELLLSIGVAIVVPLAAWLAYRRGALTGRSADPAGSLWADWLGLPLVLDRAVIGPTYALAEALARFDDRFVDGGIRAAAALGRWISRGGARSVEPTFTGALRGLVRLTKRAAAFSSLTDERGVDRTVDGLAYGVGVAGRGARRLQTGATPTYYLIVACGLATLVAFAWLWHMER